MSFVPKKNKQARNAYYKKKSTRKPVDRQSSKAKAGRGLLGSIGGLIGRGLGVVLPDNGVLKKAGQIYGGIGDSLIRNITGMGEYHIKTSSLMGQDPPTMHGTGKSNHCVRVKHREYLGDVISGNANTFTIRGLALNPSNGGVFPWLAPISTQFQMWRPMGIGIEFKSTSADALNSVNTALGTVIMATEYNANTRIFQSKIQMENSQYSNSCKPSVNMLHMIECDPSQLVSPLLYVNLLSDVGIANDRRFNTLGNFYYATSGFQGTNVNCGELWITYDIELSFPIMKANAALLGDHFVLPTSVSASNYFGTVIPSFTSSSNLGTVLTANQIVFPINFTGSVQINYVVIGSSTSIVPPVLTGTNGVTPLLLIANDLASFEQNSSISTTLINVNYFNIAPIGDGTAPTITFTGGTLPVSVSYADLFVSTMQVQN